MLSVLSLWYPIILEFSPIKFASSNSANVSVFSAVVNKDLIAIWIAAEAIYDGK
jgi:hypothetical protein